MSSAEGGPRRAAGQIKWFDPVKGFGFILDDEGGPDILLHANVLRSFGQNSIADGSRVEVEVMPTARGLQASSILTLSPPADQNPRPLAELAFGDSTTLAELPFLPARVKWFDKAKGFGFATVFGQSEDVFLHYEVLRHGGFADVASGEAVALRVLKGGRGLMAVQVVSWDRVIDHAKIPDDSAGGADPQGAEGTPPPGDDSGVRNFNPQQSGAAPMIAPPPSPIGAAAVATPPLLAAERH